MTKILLIGGSGFIGTFLRERLSSNNFTVKVLDIKGTSHKVLQNEFTPCSILNFEDLTKNIINFKPEIVINLAANPSLKSKSPHDFPEIINGTENLIKIFQKIFKPKLYIHFSTQYVVKPGLEVKDENYLFPYTAYGESKAIAEKNVFEKCNVPWIILRPTNIWGPMHPFFPNELWKLIEDRKYFHPGFKAIVKNYGYVENIASDVALLCMKENYVHYINKVRYLSDGEIDNYKWMNGFSLELSGKKALIIPRNIWFLLASIGSFLKFFNIKLPIDLGRYFRLTVNENIQDELILKLEKQRISLNDAIVKSCNWYRNAKV